MGEVELALSASAWPEDEFVRGLAGISEAGFRAMEARASVVPEYEDRVLVFQEMLQREGVTLAAVGFQLRPITLETMEEEIERCANVARFLRANRSELLVLRPPPRRLEGEDLEDWKLAIDAMNQVGRRTIDLDVRTCISPWAGTICESRREVDKLVDQTDPEFVRLCADLGFLAWAEMSAAHFFKRNASRIDYVRVHDVRKRRPRKGKPEAPKPAVFGKGVVKISSLARLVDSIDYSGWVTVECPGKKEDPVETCRAAGETARHVLGLA